MGFIVCNVYVCVLSCVCVSFYVCFAVCACFIICMCVFYTCLSGPFCILDLCVKLAIHNAKWRYLTQPDFETVLALMWAVTTYNGR